MILSRNKLKRVGESRDLCWTRTVVLNQYHNVVEKDCTGGLVIKVFDYTDRVGAVVVRLHGCPHGCMPNLLKAFLKSMKTW